MKTLQIYIIRWYFSFSQGNLQGDNLGNIKQTHIKNTAKELVKRFPDQFTSNDFQHNKEKVDELAEISSKLIRNKVAGYITRYLASQKQGRLRRPISE